VHYTLDLLIAEDDLVAVRWTMTGTHTGPWGDQPPTGRRLSYSGVNIFRFSEGKVVEIWNHRDDLGAQQQLNAPIYAGATGK
jgi:predicted ester cyclase